MSCHIAHFLVCVFGKRKNQFYCWMSDISFLPWQANQNQSTESKQSQQQRRTKTFDFVSAPHLECQAGNQYYGHIKNRNGSPWRVHLRHSQSAYRLLLQTSMCSVIGHNTELILFVFTCRSLRIFKSTLKKHSHTYAGWGHHLLTVKLGVDWELKRGSERVKSQTYWAGVKQHQLGDPNVDPDSQTLVVEHVVDLQETEQCYYWFHQKRKDVKDSESREESRISTLSCFMMIEMIQEPQAMILF